MACYRDPGALRSVEINDDGLFERRPLRRPRRLSWLQVRGVRWVRRGLAEVECCSGATVRLPRGGELVAEIEARAAAAQARWRDQGPSPALVRAWLGVRPYGEYVHNPNGLWPGFGALLAVAASAFLQRGGPGFAAAAALFTAGLAILLWAVTHIQPVVRANAEGVRLKRFGVVQTVAWRDLRVVHVTHRGRVNRYPHLRLETADAAVDIDGGACYLAPVAECATRSAEANRATFATAGAEPPPDTALSPARLTGDAERGLSRSDGRPGSADLQVRVSPEQCGPGGPRSQEE